MLSSRQSDNLRSTYLELSKVTTAHLNPVDRVLKNLSEVTMLSGLLVDEVGFICRLEFFYDFAC